MIISRPSGAALTSVDAALALLLDGVAVVAAVDEPLATVLGGVAAETPPLAHSLPAADEAMIDGYAFLAQEIVGASSYSPVVPSARPSWIEAGQAMPAGCDCVLDAGLVDLSGPVVQVLGDAIPGEGVRRVGQDMAVGTVPIPAGRRISAIDLLAARQAGLESLSVRRPRLRVLDVGGSSSGAPTTELVIDLAKAAGAQITATDSTGRDTSSVIAALDDKDCDALVLVGGTGTGRTDNTAEGLAARGILLAHGIALQPGRTSVIGRLGTIPVIALPGAPDQALGAYWALVQPVLDRLSGRQARKTVMHPLARKIASGVGITEIVLLTEVNEQWMPLAAGALPLDQLRAAEAWLAVPGDSEGFASGTPVAAYPFSDP